MREFPSGITDSRGPRPSGSRLGSRLRWVGAAAAIGGSLVWLAVGDDKGMAIFSGVMAIVVGRVLLGGQTPDPEGSDADRHGSTPD